MSNDRTILMLTADAGACHKSVTLALEERFDKTLPGSRLEIVNAYEELLDFPLSLINNAHKQIVRYSPRLWNLLFETTSSGRRFSTIEGLARPLTKDRVEDLFDKMRPSAVISVIPLVNSLVGEVAARRGIPFVVVVTDMARIHPAWFSDSASLFCAPTEFSKAELVRLGVAADKISVTGLPARNRFFGKQHDREALRETLGIGQESFAILMMGGGEGVGVSKKAITELTGLPGVELYIFTGRNERLRKRIERRFGGSVRTLGFVNNVDEWLKAADLLITKSGPSTLVEAAACGLPTLFIGALPGQEQSIIDSLLLSSTAGEELLCSAESISGRIGELMVSAEKRQELVDSITDFASPGASTYVCALIETLLVGGADALHTYA